MGGQWEPILNQKYTLWECDGLTGLVDCLGDSVDFSTQEKNLCLTKANPVLRTGLASTTQKCARHFQKDVALMYTVKFTNW